VTDGRNVPIGPQCKYMNKRAVRSDPRRYVCAPAPNRIVPPRMVMLGSVRGGLVYIRGPKVVRFFAAELLWGCASAACQQATLCYALRYGVCRVAVTDSPNRSLHTKRWGAHRDADISGAAALVCSLQPTYKSSGIKLRLTRGWVFGLYLMQGPHPGSRGSHSEDSCHYVCSEVPSLSTIPEYTMS
jgi:hypothetical protein